MNGLLTQTQFYKHQSPLAMRIKMDNRPTNPPKRFKIGTREYLLPADFNINDYVYSTNEAMARQHLWIPEQDRIQAARCVVGCAIEDVLREYIRYVPQLLMSEDPELAEVRQRLLTPDGTFDYRRLLEMDLKEESLDERIGRPPQIDLAKAEALCDTYHALKSRPLAYDIHTTSNGNTIYLPHGMSVVLYIDGARNALNKRHNNLDKNTVEQLARCIVGCTLEKIQERIIEQRKPQVLFSQTPALKELRDKISESSGMPIWEKLTSVYLTERELKETFADINCIDLTNTAEKYCSEYNSWLTRRQDLIGKPHLDEIRSDYDPLRRLNTKR